MAGKSFQNLQYQLNQITATRPDLQHNEQWAKTLTELKQLSEGLNLQELLLEVTTAISNAISSIAEVDELLPIFVQLIKKRLGFKYVGIFLTDETNQWIKLEADTKRSKDAKPAYYKIEDHSSISQAVQQQRPCIAEITKKLSELVIPLSNRGQVIGVLKLQTTKQEIFTDNNIRLFLPLADQLASAIQNARLLAGTDQQLEQLVTLYNINMRIGSHLDVGALLKEVAQVSIKLLNADVTVIRLVNKSKTSFTIKAGYNLPAGLKLNRTEKFGAGLSTIVFETRQPILANNWPDHPLATDYSQTIAQFGDVLSILNVPMAIQHEVIGTIEVFSHTRTQAFGENDLYILSLLASQTAIAVENARLLNQAENNRRFLKTIIDHIPDPIFIKDKNHTWIEMNQANANVIGGPSEEMIGQTDRNYFSKELAEEFYRRDNEVIRTNRIFEHEDKTVWGDGQEHIAYTRLIPIPDVTGQPEYILGISHDVTERKAHEAERERFLTETAALYNGSRTIAGALSERQVFEALFDQLRLENPCQISAFRYDTVKDKPIWVTLKAGWQKQSHPAEPTNTRFYLPETPHARLLTLAEPFFIEDVATDARLSETERKVFEVNQARSIAILPLIATGQALGLIIIYFTSPYTFSEVTKRFWLAMVDQAGVALSNRQLIQEAAYRAVQMETAAEVARAASLLDLHELLTAAVALIGDRFHLYYVGIFLVDETETWAVLRAGTGEAGRIQLEKKHRLKIGNESMIGWSIYHRRPRIALDVGEDAVRFANPYLPDTRSEMALPLIYRNKAIGALTVQSTEAAAFSREDFLFLQTMADQLANAIENARLYEKAQQEITERKRAEQESRASEKKYRELVENANSIIFRMNVHGRVTFFNKFAQEFFGYSEEEILGRPVLNTIVPQVDLSGQALKEMVDGILRHPEQYTNNENENIRRDGTRVWISWANKAILNDEGNIVEILCIGNDITERRKALAEREQAQKALATRERYLATQLDIQNYLLAYRGSASPYDKILKLLGRVSGAGRVRVFENYLDANEGQVISQRAEWCAKGIQAQIDNPAFQNVPYQQFLPRWVASLGQGEIISGQVADFAEPERAVLEAQGIKAILVLPLMVSGEFFGFISFDNCLEARLWEPSEINLLRSAASSISLWRERRRAEDSLLKALERTESLYRIGDAITTGTEEQPTFEEVLGEYLRLISLKWGAISLVNKAGVQKVYALYVEGQPVQTDMVISVKVPIFQHLLKNPAPLIIDDTFNHPLTKDTQHVRSQLPAKSMLYIPIMLRGQVMGVLAAGAPQKDYPFSQSDIEIGQVVTDQLAIWLENRRLLAEAQYRSDRLQTAAEVSRASSSILDVDELINTSVNLIQDQFGFYYVGLFLVDEAREWAILRAGTGDAGRLQLDQGHQLKIGNESMIGWSIHNRKARIALDVGQDAVRFKNPALPDTHSEMALPLISREEVLGALTVQSTERGAFSDEDITLLQTMADQLANVITNARLFESVVQAQAEAETLLQETVALQQLSAALASTLQVNELLDIFFAACTMELGFDYVQIAMVDKQNQRIRAIAGMGVTESNIQRANRSLDSNDIMADIIRTGKTEVITGWDERFHRETYEAEGHANWIRVYAPITLRQENIGLVEAGFNKGRNKRFEESQIRLLRAFIDQTALAIDNAQRYEASQQRAHREALLKEITTKVRASTDLDTILQTTVKEIGEAIGSKRTSIHLISPAKVSGNNGTPI